MIDKDKDILQNKDSDSLVFEGDVRHHHHSSGHSKRRRKRHRSKKQTTLRVVLIVCLVLVVLGGITAILAKQTYDEAMYLKAEATELKTDIKQVLEDVKAKNVDATYASMESVDAHSANMRKILNNKKWKFLAKIKVTNAYIKPVKQLLNIVDQAEVEVINPLLEVVRDYPTEKVKVGDGFNVNVINEYINLLETIQPSVIRLADEFNRVKLPARLGINLDEYSEKLNSLAEAYNKADNYIPLLKALFSTDGDRYYILAAQNSAELRAGDGFPGSIGTVKIEDGILTIGDFESVYTVLTEKTPESANVTDKEIELYSEWLLYSRDASYNPDFERVATTWCASYEQCNNTSINGVISLTPGIIQELLAYIGEVQLSDGTVLNGNNAASILQKDLYYQYLNVEKTSIPVAESNYVDGFFAETAKVVMSRLVGDFDFNRVQGYGKIFGAGAANRTILMWMKNETEQEYVKAAGYSGCLNYDKNDPKAGVYFSIGDSCKLGWFLNIDTTLGDAVVNEDGTRTYDVTVVLNNTITSEQANVKSYIVGLYGGSIKGYLHLFAPAGGTISNIKASDGTNFIMSEYKDLQVGYTQDIMIHQNTPITITYQVTTAKGVYTPLGLSQTPTLQKYRQ